MTTSRPAFGTLTAEQFQSLIEQTSDVITVVDEEGTVQYQSPNCERVKGWSPNELVGENVFDYVHPDDKGRIFERFSTLVAERGVIAEEVEFRFRCKGGEYIWLSVTGAAANADLPVDGYVMTSRDISTRKAYEETLIEQRDDLETLNEVLRHDIRNDLQLVSAYAEMLEDHVDSEGEEFLDTIQQSADNAVDLTASARDLAEVLLRPNTAVDNVSLARILHDQIETIRSTYGDAVLVVDDTIPEIDVQAGDLLSSVCRNILKNAIQHNDKAIPEITVSVEQTGDDVTIRFADNGPGVRDEIKEEIFGKGEKGLESAGTGIGLYLVRTLVEGYGGAVWAEDNDPEGAVFVVELRVAD